MAFAIQRGINNVVDAPFAAFEQHGVSQLLARAVAAGEFGEHLGGVARFRDRGHAEGDKVGRVVEVGLQIASVAYGALLGVFLLGWRLIAQPFSKRRVTR